VLKASEQRGQRGRSLPQCRNRGGESIFFVPEIICQVYQLVASQTSIGSLFICVVHLYIVKSVTPDIRFKANKKTHLSLQTRATRNHEKNWSNSTWKQVADKLTTCLK